MDPAEAVLVPKGSGLALPLAAGQVSVNPLVAEKVHRQRGDGDALDRLGAIWAPDAQTADDPVSSAAEEPEHLAGMPGIEGLAQDLAVAFGHRVAGHDRCAGCARANVGRLLS